MMQHNLSCWPLALSASRGEPDLNDLRGYSAVWTAWLDRDEPFAMLRIYCDRASDGHPPGGAREGKDWFRAEGERFSRQVLAMAAVAPPELVLKKNKLKGGVQRGVPIRAFTQAQEAVDWLLPHLQKKYPDIDVLAFKARILDWCAAHPVTCKKEETAQ